jgi:restriction system protein
VVIPAMFGANPLLRPLGGMLTPLAWLLAWLFGLIAFFRFATTRRGLVDTVGADPGVQRRAAPVAPQRVEPNLLDRDGQEIPPPRTAAAGLPLGRVTGSA